MESKEKLIALREKIDKEYSEYDLKNTDNDLERATQYFDEMLTDFYEKVPIYLIERSENEKGKQLPYRESINYFYYQIRPPRYSMHLYKNYLQEQNTAYPKIDKLVFNTRKKLCDEPTKIGKNFSTEQQCAIAAIEIQHALKNQNELSSSFLATNLSFGIPNNPHAFNYIKTKTTGFIIDCTFSQFTKLYKMNLGIMKLPKETVSAEPTYFLLQTEEGKELLNKLLKNGYFEATPENVKLYLDSFVLSNRNANYHLNNNMPLYNTGISSDYYMNEIDKLLQVKQEDNRYPIKLYDEVESAKIYGLEDIGFGCDFLAKEEIKKINQKILKNR